RRTAPPPAPAAKRRRTSSGSRRSLSRPPLVGGLFWYQQQFAAVIQQQQYLPPGKAVCLQNAVEPGFVQVQRGKILPVQGIVHQHRQQRGGVLPFGGGADMPVGFHDGPKHLGRGED